jgi:hypothetical protein
LAEGNDIASEDPHHRQPADEIERVDPLGRTDRRDGGGRVAEDFLPSVRRKRLVDG